MPTGWLKTWRRWVRSDITIVTPVSPIPSHPDFGILRETLESVRFHIPDAEIMLMFDGVRAEQEHMRGDYEEAIRRILWWADKELGNVCPFIFDEQVHQVGMLRKVIGEIKTPLMMFVEQDTPLLTDRVIDWPLITSWLLEGKSNCIRAYHEESVPASHGYLFFGREADAPLLRTSQYSARPHVATVIKYREWLTHFTPQANTFLEDLLHSVVQENVKHHGWWSEKCHVYAPENDQGFRRSGHLDGRAGGPKFEAELVF